MQEAVYIATETRRRRRRRDLRYADRRCGVGQAEHCLCGAALRRLNFQGFGAQENEWCVSWRAVISFGQ